ncbi:MAG: LamG domain-containing protein, partial [Candidatus Portnoybacteria bacterium]|nr:LamG domain-containing protein [Candidatus Portnoybacteria bacterium]
PSLSSSSPTTFYIWYNKSGETQPAEDNAYGKENVWHLSFKMVQHMNQDPSGTAPQMIDSTANNNDGTSGGTMTTSDQVAGQVDGSLDFDGVDDYVDITSSDFDFTSATDEISISAWVKTSTVIDALIISFRDSVNTSPVLDFQLGATGVGTEGVNTGKPSYTIRGDNGVGLTSGIGTNDLRDGNWHHVVMTIDSAKLISIYADGFFDVSETHGLTGTITTNSKWIGKESINSSVIDEFLGLIDEVRISNVARTEQWIATEYNNQSDVASFLTIGAEESLSVPATRSGGENVKTRIKGGVIFKGGVRF